MSDSENDTEKITHLNHLLFTTTGTETFWFRDQYCAHYILQRVQAWDSSDQTGKEQLTLLIPSKGRDRILIKGGINRVRFTGNEKPSFLTTNPEEYGFKNHNVNSPGWCGSVDCVPACETKGHWFDSQSGHMPGLWVRSPVGGAWEATTHWCFSPPLSHPLPLSKKK